jgi:siroheme synthase
MALKDKKLVGAPFVNGVDIVRVVYDFDVDSGAIADYDVLEAVEPCAVKVRHIQALEEITSADATNIDLGKNDGGTEFLSNAVKASFGTNAIQGGVAGAVVRLGAGDKVVMGIEAHAVTAGKIEFVFEVTKCN